MPVYLNLFRALGRHCLSSTCDVKPPAWLSCHTGVKAYRPGLFSDGRIGVTSAMKAQKGDGVCISNVQRGDTICILFGGRFPFVLRQVAGARRNNPGRRGIRSRHHARPGNRGDEKSSRNHASEVVRADLTINWSGTDALWDYLEPGGANCIGMIEANYVNLTLTWS
jgi:hypothetical protein